MIICPRDYDFENKEPERWRLKMRGAHMVTLSSDSPLRLWGIGCPGADLVACLVEAPTGAQHLMGRLRIHLDGKLRNSLDKRLPVHVIFSPGTRPHGDVCGFAKNILSGLMTGMGFVVGDIEELDLEGQGKDAVAKGLEQLAYGNWDMSIMRID